MSLYEQANVTSTASQRWQLAIGLERRFRKALIAVIILLHIALCMYGAWVHSPTVDEPAYLASGLSHWQFGRFDLCKVSPPLVRLVAAIPVMLAQPNYDWKGYRIGPGVRAEHTVGRDFLVANGEQSFWLFTIGRWGCIPFSLIGAYVCYRWAFELFGVASAYAALLLWCFSPNILAHAELLTPDIGVTALCVTACYSFWRWSGIPTWPRTLTWGIVLGLALLAKTNAIVLFAAFPIIFMINCWSGKQYRRIRAAIQMTAGIATAVYTLHLGYGFDGTCLSLGEYKFFSAAFVGNDGANRFKDSLLHSVPVPLPSGFVEGMDLQRRDFENAGGSMKTYFRGEWYDHGWWWYYLYVVAVKVPVGTLMLCAFAICFLRTHPRASEFFLFIAIPGMLLFGLPCTQAGFGHGLRYILPAAPFAFLTAAGMLSTPQRRMLTLISAFLVLTSLVSSLRTYPHSLSYFNELAGGPLNGHFHLLDGNVDWGQDLLFIRNWLQQNPEQRPVFVAYWGVLPTKELKINFLAPSIRSENSIPRGTYLISVNFLRKEFRNHQEELDVFNELQSQEAITPAIRLYKVR